MTDRIATAEIRLVSDTLSFRTPLTYLDSTLAPMRGAPG